MNDSEAHPPVFRYRRYGVTIMEAWFDVLAPGQSRSDVIDYRQLPRPFAGTRTSPFRTLIVPLSDPTETIFDQMKKDTRRDIRRAEDRDRSEHAFCEDGGSGVEEFLAFDALFARHRGIAPAQAEGLRALAAQQALALSRVTHNGETLSWHVFVVGSGRARLLHSPSLAGDDARRQIVGRANRFHHWRDMLHFKSVGADSYDLGGWSGSTAPALARIDRFKEEFGGRLTVEYNCTATPTLVGRSYDWLRKMRSRSGL